jgi:hypothetical protein
LKLSFIEFKLFCILFKATQTSVQLTSLKLISHTHHTTVFLKDGRSWQAT